MLTGPAWLALEVKYLDRAASFYEAFLDLDVCEREVALAAGGTDLLLRAPGDVPRGGVHVDFGIRTDDVESTAERARRDALAVEEIENGLRLRDPDGHYVTLVE